MPELECANCGDHTSHVSRRAWCDYCEAEAERQVTAAAEAAGVPAERLGPTVLLRDYNVELAELLEATEGHSDPLVRATRKIVTQAALALRAAYDQSSGSDEPAANPPSRAAGATPASEPEPHKTQGERLAALDVTAQQIRQWAIEKGLTYSKRGRLSNELIDLYEAAQPQHTAA